MKPFFLKCSYYSSKHHSSLTLMKYLSSALSVDVLSSGMRYPHLCDPVMYMTVCVHAGTCMYITGITMYVSKINSGGKWERFA